MPFLPSLLAAVASLQSPPAPLVEHSETILVTAVASRVPQQVDATPATVSVIGREDLERGLARDLRGALRYEPGISVESSAARFGIGNIAIRGLEGNRVQMLHDGVRLPDGFRIGSFSNASRNPFDLALLSRVEILRGPGSALYGSDALAGVVSMTTLDPRDLMARRARHGGFAEAAYANADDSGTVTAAAATRAGAAEMLLGASAAEGHERDNRGDHDGLGAARTRPNPQDAATRAALAKLVWNTAGDGRWRITYDHFERGVETDVRSLNPQSPRTVSLAGDDRAARTRASLDAVLYGVGFVDRLSLLAYGQRSRTRQDTVEVRANTTAQCLSAAGSIACRREARFRFDQDEAGFTAIGQSAAGLAHDLVYGIEGSRTTSSESRDGRQVNLNTGTISNVVGTDVFPTRDFPRSRVERIGAFVQDEIAFGRMRLVPALRYDRFEMTPMPDATYLAANPTRPAVALTDSAWSPKLGALVPLAPAYTLALQAAAGFRAPPYFDVNVGLSNLPLGFTVIPNAQLRPEKSRGLEASLRARHAAIEWSLTAYRTGYTDLIVSRAPLPCPGDPRCVAGAPLTFQSQNVTRARIEGVEARAQWRVSPQWTARLGASAARGEDRTRGTPLNSVDPPKVVAGLEWNGLLPVVTPAPAGAQVHVTHVARKSRIDHSAGTFFATPAFTTIDLTGSVQLARHLTLRAGVFNLTDEKHWLWSDVRAVPNPGASIDRYTQPGRNVAVQLKATF